MERNYGKNFLSETERKAQKSSVVQRNPRDCSLYFTKGILKSSVMRNYQYEYARKQKDKNLYEYYDNHRIVKNNIRILTDMLKKTLAMRAEDEEILSDRGRILPKRLWRIGRSGEARVFERRLWQDKGSFVVDVLIDASGSQRNEQGQVAIQAYILSEALSNVEDCPSGDELCTFWDYTILRRFRDYDAPRTENSNIFEYVTSFGQAGGTPLDGGLFVENVGSTWCVKQWAPL